MERRPEESFADYKVRRATSNAASKAINRAANAGGNLTSRQIQRNAKRKNGKLLGTYGKDIMASFDSRRPDLAQRQERHAAYLQHQANRAAARIAERTELKLAA